MRNNNISRLVEAKLPEHVRELYPNFVEFIGAYYEFMEKREQAVGVLNYNPQNKDIDDTLDEFIEHFYATYAEYLPKNSAYNQRDTIKRLRDLYEAKGTEKATKLFFRLIYGRSVDVSYPSQQILRASDGTWNQPNSIRLQVTAGNINTLVDQELSWTNSSGQYKIVATDFKFLEGTLYEVFVTFKTPFVLNVGDVLTSSGGFRALALAAPSSIRILNAGRNFKIGQLITIPGTIRNTLIRIVDVGNLGEIVRAQIISFGYSFTSNFFNIVPFNNFPVSSSNSIEEVDEGFEATISDTLSQIGDYGSVLKLAGFGSPDSYFLENYIEETIDTYYVGFEAANFDDRVVNSDPIISSDIDIDEYNRSIATIEIVFTTLSKYPGQFTTNNGLISNPEIRIQDSFYYQAFSYVVDVDLNLRDYKTAFVNMLHPAGLKLFSRYLLNSNIDISSSISILFNKLIRLEFNDFVSPDDELFKSMSISQNDIATIAETFAKTFSTTVSDSATTSDDLTKSITKGLSESVTSNDDIAKSLSMSQADTTAATDAIPAANTYVDNTYFSEIYVSDTNATEDVYVWRYPEALFAANEQGAWYEPNDMSTLYQDAAMTTPVTAVNQSVNAMRDKSGRNHHMVTTGTSGVAPILAALHNGLVRTEELATSWTLENVTITSNVIVAPDGNTTADKINETAATGRHLIFQGVSADYKAREVYLSAYVKAAERTFCTVFAYTSEGADPAGGIAALRVDLTSGTITQEKFTNCTKISSSIVSVGDGWYRVSVAAQKTALGTIWTGAAVSAEITGVISGGTTDAESYAGTAGSGIYAWGLQFTTEAYPEQYQRVSTPTVYNDVGFLRYLNFNGSTSRLRTIDDIDFSATSKFHLTLGFRHYANTGNKTILQMDENVTGGWAFYDPLFTGTTAFLINGNNVFDFSPVLPFARTYVVSANIDRLGANKAAQAQVRTNASPQTITQAFLAMTGNFLLRPMSLGYSIANNNQWKGKFYGMVLRDRLLDTVQVQNLEFYINNLTKAY